MKTRRLFTAQPGRDGTPCRPPGERSEAGGVADAAHLPPAASLRSPRTARSVVPACGFAAGLAAAIFLAGNAGALAAEKVAGFDAFRLMRTKNMFDPSRRPARTETASARTTAPGRENKSSTLTLTGTMVTDGKVLAFFSGTRADYSKVLSVGGTIADCKITAITATEVEMERGGKPGTLAVGHQLQIDGAPSDVPAPEPTAAAPAPGAAPADSAAPATGGPTAGPAPSNDKSDVLRRMMERREKEMNK